MKKKTLLLIVITSFIIGIFLLYIGFAIDSPFVKYLATTLTIITPFGFPLVQYLIKKLKHDNEIKMTPISKIVPFDIMGDRGLFANGFKEELYCKRSIDREIVDIVNRRSKSASIIIISGGGSSGKSRAIYNFIKSEKCPSKFKYVYIVDSNNVGLLAKHIKYANKDPEIFIFDDVNFIYDSDKESLFALLAIINSSKSKVAFVTYANENVIGTDKENIVKLISDNTLVRNKESRPLESLIIPDIEFNSIEHNWCLANLYPYGAFSPIIGSYIKELQKLISEKIKTLLESDNAIDVFTAYITFSKYRKSKCTELKYTFLMFASQHKNKTLADFNNGLTTLLELDYLLVNGKNKALFYLEKHNGDDIDDTDDVCNYIDLLTNGEINCGKQQIITIKDWKLFNEFLQRIALGEIGCKNRTIQKYLLHNSQCEVNKAKALIRIDCKDPTYYSRAITKASNVEPVVDEVVKLLIENEMLSPSKKIISSEAVKEDMNDLITIIISRQKWNEFEQLKTEVEEYIKAGFIPTTTLVAEILRIALYNHQMRAEIEKYAEELMASYSLTPNVYYYQRLEQLDGKFNINRILAIVAMFKGQEKTEIDRYNLFSFSNNLLCKAVTKAKIDILFDEILPDIKKQSLDVIRFNKNAVLNLMSKFTDTNNVTKGDLLLHLIRKLRAHVELIDDCRVVYMYLKATDFTSNYNDIKNIYMEALDEQPDNKIQRLMALNLFKSVKNYNEFKESLEIFEHLLKMKEGKGASLKLFNTLLSSAPSFEEATELVYDYKQYMDYDIFTINSLFKCVFSLCDRRDLEIHILNRITENALSIEQMRKNYKNIYPDSSYLSNFYNVAKCYISRRERTPVPEQIIAIIKELKKEGTIMMTAPLKSQEIDVMSIDEVFNESRSILLDMKNGVAKDTDIITSLLRAAIRHYRNDDLYDNLKSIYKIQDRIINRSIHYHRQLILVRIMYNEYGEKGSIDINMLKDDIFNSLTDLNDNFKPLFAGKIDIFTTVINVLDFDDAKKIVLYAKELSVVYKNVRGFNNIFRSAHIMNLCTLINGSEAGSENRLDEIQKLISENPDLLLNDYERRTINKINKVLRNGGPPIVYIPLLNTDREIRHQYWEWMKNNDSINNASDYDIQTFIKMEVVDITHNAWNPDIIKEEFLIEALEYFGVNNNSLSPFVNDAFIRYRVKNENTKCYDNFFEAFMYLRCIKPNNMDRWSQLGEKFGYDF